MTTVFSRLALCLAMTPLLAGCGETNARYLLDAPSPAQRVGVRVSTIEVRDVQLPDYASASEIVVQDEAGALLPLSSAIWADDPVRGISLALARNLDAASSATAMTEPWPLAEPPDARVDVRVERMVAQFDGQFRLSGQYAISSPDRVVRERIERFEILRPMADQTPTSVAAATSGALLTLSEQIASRLR
ncbi:membrane integrity-associated transporter subunit PqiC [Sedimentitalea sp. XS_ASV28]|uniref:PqiC family protein n=1 Tax=Sedimentitalea sp. XS_ASV28 TaxID=3241296 RepID=UPI0035172228